jgi:integral membrane protein
MILKTPLGRLRLMAFVEGTSFLLIIFVTMPLKYIAHIHQPNMVVGLAHGILFVLYCLLLLQVVIEMSWNWRQALLGFVASVIPFGTFYADKVLFKPLQDKKI